MRGVKESSVQYNICRIFVHISGKECVPEILLIKIPFHLCTQLFYKELSVFYHLTLLHHAGDVK